MSTLEGVPDSLYRRLLTVRRILPLAAFVLVVVQEIVEKAWLHSLPFFQYFASELLFYATIWSVIGWLFLTVLARRVRERDRAEAHLRALYQTSQQAITATETKDLVGIALRMPEQVIDLVGTAVILREHPAGPWILAGTHGFRAEQREALDTYLTSTGANVHCDQCTIMACTERWNCPLLSALSEGLEPEVVSVICLPLSAERPPHALLYVYLPEEANLTHAEGQVLESMTSGLAVAMDRARLQARALEMAYQMDQTVRRRDGPDARLNHILENIATALRAEAGAVFLASQEIGRSGLIPIASWPEDEIPPHLPLSARQALREGRIVVGPAGGEGEQVMAVPLVAESLVMGTLVLAGRPPFSASEGSVLSITPGMIALMIRNSQLYTQLESQAVLEERSRLAREVHDGVAQYLGALNFRIQKVDRLLLRRRQEAARQALQELREGIQDAYTEVRLTIQDLRWSLEDGQGLAEHLEEYVAAFAKRTGLAISLTVEGEPNLTPRAKIHLFRITQEALTNVDRHSHSQRVWVRLSASAEGTALEVEDDGVGLPAEYGEGELPPEAAGHFGLHIIQERVEAVGGQLSLHSGPGQGSKLKITVPTPDVSIQPKVGNWAGSLNSQEHSPR